MPMVVRREMGEYHASIRRIPALLYCIAENVYGIRNTEFLRDTGDRTPTGQSCVLYACMLRSTDRVCVFNNRTHELIQKSISPHPINRTHRILDTLTAYWPVLLRVAYCAVSNVFDPFYQS